MQGDPALGGGSPVFNVGILATNLCQVCPAPLQVQVEQFEADIEALGPQKGKTKSPRCGRLVGAFPIPVASSYYRAACQLPADCRVVELEAFIQRHRDHVTKLEQV